jgi:hypothetical protein
VKPSIALPARWTERPTLARAEVIDKVTRGRFEDELEAALKRKSVHEGKLSGALRAVAPLSPALRAAMCDAATTMLHRKSFARDLYVACMRSLAEWGDKRAAALLRAALSSEEAGGSAALSAACFSRDEDLGPVLAKIAVSRQAHVAFGAETARVMRGESNGAHLTALAPMIKESHRIALCVELLVPLARFGSCSPRGSLHTALAASPALAVLRGAERHLGRWLVMAEVAVKSGDRAPLEEARAKALIGPASARAAWSLVTWALSQHAPPTLLAGTTGAPLPVLSPPPAVDLPLPETRPTVELVSRLSDRPSADRDTTFLFRMARARAPSAKPMLEMLAKGPPLGDEVSVRAALCLAKDYGRDDLRAALLEVATAPRREELRGLATAALWDLGAMDQSRDLASDLSSSKVVGNVAWAALVRAAWTRARAEASKGESVVGEIPFRWIQWGWLE